jgi:hypothetical protein
MKSFKVRIFYDAFFDMNIDAPSEEHARDIVEDYAMDFAEDAKMQYDFAEIHEIGSV